MRKKTRKKVRRLVVCSHTYFNDMCVEIFFLSFNELWFAVNRIPQQLPDGRREKLELPIHIMNCLGKVV